MSRIGYALLWIMLLTGTVGPRLFQLIQRPDLTEAQLFRMFWWCYLLAAMAAALMIWEMRTKE